MELVVIILLLRSLERLTAGGAIRRRLVIVNDGGGLRWSWLASDAVSFVLVVMQQDLRSEGQLTLVLQAGEMVVQIDVFFKGIRTLEYQVTLSTDTVFILKRFCLRQNPSSTFRLRLQL